MNGQSHYYYSTNYDLKNTNKKIMKKILIIDDETITIHIIKFTLEDNPNFEIVTATDGSKAIEYLEKNIPDLIISDLVMPFKTGVEVVSYVNQKYPKVPIIVISSLAPNHTSVQEVKKLNISYYILKPLDSKILKNCVIELLSNNEILNSNESQEKLIPIENNIKASNNNLTNDNVKTKGNIIKKSKNKDVEIVKTLSNDENKTEIQLSEKKVSENKKSDKKIIKIKTIIKENKKVGNKLIKKLKIKLFEQEFDDEKTKKTLKKLQDISKLHFDFIKKLEELKK